MYVGSDERLDPVEMREALARVLRSRVFRLAHRSQRLLTYLVHKALARPPLVVKEYTLAIEVFDRGQAYDPSVDATVRVEAGRLRSRLREYYDEEGRHDPWLIEVPKGGYAVSFSARHDAATVGLAQEAAGLPSPAPAAGFAPLSAAAVDFSTAVTGAVTETRDTRARTVPSWTWAALLFVLLGVGAMFALQRFRHRPEPSSSVQRRTLAILPILNRTGDAEMTLVLDGLTDDLIRQLSQVPALKLIARSTVFHYRERASDPRSVARELGVSTVLTGELHRTAEHTVLAVELTDAQDGSVLLDREYSVDADDLRSAQAELQHDVLLKLHAEDSARDPTRLLPSVTSNPQAYREFLLADALARSGAPPDLHQAMVHAQKAVSLDPKFDLAWAALASEHVFLAIYFEPPREQMPLARHFAERALALNPNLGEAHGTLGLVHLLYDWNPSAAAAEMSTADAQAAAVGGLACTAHLMQIAGRPNTAQDLISRMLTYDPHSAALIAEMGCVDFYRGQYDAALRYYRQALAADPQSPMPYWGLGKTLNAENRHAEALVALSGFRQRNGFEPPLLTAESGYAWGAAGNQRQALAVVRDLEKKGRQTWIDPYLIAVVYLSMKDRDNAFLWLNRALDVRSPFAISILTEPKWQPLRSDPRFAECVERMLRNHGQAPAG